MANTTHALASQTEPAAVHMPPLRLPWRGAARRSISACTPVTTVPHTSTAQPYLDGRSPTCTATCPMHKGRRQTKGEASAAANVLAEPALQSSYHTVPAT
jgi:hypothetical protein